MIKNIKNKYVRRAVWLVAIVPIGIFVTVCGAVLGVMDLLSELKDAAVRAW
jgi:hypothetical protein